MGSSPGGFLSGMFNVIGPRLEEKHQQHLALENQKKQGEYGTYWNSMQAAASKLATLKSKGDLSPEEEKEAQTLAAQYAWSEGQLNKMTKGSKPLSEAFQKVGGFVKQILSHPSPNGQLQPPQGAQPAQAQPQLDAQQQQPAPGQPSQPLQPPAAAPSMQGAMALSQQMNPDAVKQRNSDADRQRRKKSGQAAGLTGRDLVDFEETGKLPPQAAVGTRKQVRFQMGDGKTEVDVQYDPKTGVYYDNKNEPFEIPEGAKMVASKTSSARPTIIASDYTNTDDAKQLKESGMVFLGPDGKELDLDKIPKGMVLQKIHYSDGRTLYEPRNINDKVIKVGNVEYAVNPSQVQKLGSGAGTELGVANPASSTQREVQAVDAEGNPIAQVLNTTRTPQTTGVRGRGAQVPAAQPQPNGAPGAPALAPPAAAPRQPAQPPAPIARSGSRPLEGMTPGQSNRALDRITPVREAATQLFGDPTQPDLKGLNSFGHLADNSESRRRLGTALKLTFDQFNKATGGAAIHADAGPVSFSAGGGVMQVLENAFGVPSKLAEQSAQIMQTAIAKLTPEEREAYNATMGAFGTIVGLRSLSRASASQASVATIEREMPVIGINTTDSKQFQDQMARLAEQIYNGTKGIPAAMWEKQTPGLLARIKGFPGEAKRNKSAPSPNGKLSAPASKTKVWNAASGKFEDQ